MWKCKDMDLWTGLPCKNLLSTTRGSACNKPLEHSTIRDEWNGIRKENLFCKQLAELPCTKLYRGPCGRVTDNYYMTVFDLGHRKVFVFHINQVYL